MSREKYFVDLETRKLWLKQGFDYYHKLNGEVIFINREKKSSISFVVVEGKFIYDTVNLTINEELDNLISKTAYMLKHVFESKSIEDQQAEVKVID